MAREADFSSAFAAPMTGGQWIVCSAMIANNLHSAISDVNFTLQRAKSALQARQVRPVRPCQNVSEEAASLQSAAHIACSIPNF